MSRPQILFVLDEHENHQELVVPYLRCEPLIFDPADVAIGTELSYIQDATHGYMIIGNTLLNNVRSIWWRKMFERTVAKVPTGALEQAYGDPSFADYASRSVRRHANALGALFDKSLWVSNPYAMSRADNKAWQLRLARAVSMAVPRTLQTSSPRRAQQFVKQLDGECIVKSLSNRFPVTPEGDELMFWSQKIRSDRMTDFEGLEVAPAIFQQAIKGHDVRVTIVGDKVLPLRSLLTMMGARMQLEIGA